MKPCPPIIALALALITACSQAPSFPQPTSVTESEPFPPLAPLLASPPRTPLGPLTVVAHTPQGRTEGNPAIQVRFSLPMRAFGDDQERCERDLLHFDPPLAGKACWVGDRLLRFFPENPLPFGVPYSATLAAGLSDATGTRRLPEAVQWRFDAPRPRLLGIAPDTLWRTSLRRPFVLSFDAPMDLDTLRPFIAVGAAHFTPPAPLPPLEPREDTPTADDDASASAAAARLDEEAPRPSAFVLRYPDPGRGGGTPPPSDRRHVEVHPADAWPADARVTLTLRPGFPCADGPLGGEDGATAAIDTYGPMRLTATACTTPACRPDDGVHLTFTNDFAPGSDATPWLRIEPPVSWQVTTWMDGLSLSGDFAPHTTYTVHLAAGLRDTWGQPLPPTRITFRTGRYAPELTLEEGLVVIDRRSPRGLVATLRHNETFQLRMAPVAPDDLTTVWAWLQTPPSLEGKTPLPAAVAAAVAVTPQRQPVLDTLELALPIADFVPEGQAGALYYALDYDEGQRAEGLLLLTSLGLTAHLDGAQIVAVASDLDSAQPLPGLAAALSDRDGTRRWQGQSDAHGALVVPRSPASTQVLEVWRVDDPSDRALLPIPARAAPAATLRGAVLTDRAIYRPGDPIYFKAYPRHDTVHGLATLTTTLQVRLHDSGQRLLAERNAAPNRWGNVDGVLTLPEDARLGWARLSVFDPDLDAHIETRVRIAAYRIPDFEVNLAPVQSEIIRGAPARFNVAAALLSGTPMAQAAGQADLFGHPVNFSPPGPPGFVFTSPHVDTSGGDWLLQGQALRLDAQGTAEISFPSAPGRFDPMQYQVSVEIEDVNRQVMAAHHQVLVHPAAFYLGLALAPPPEGENHVFGDASAAQVVAVHPDGAPFRDLTAIHDLELWVRGPPPPSSPAAPAAPAPVAAPPIEVRCRPDTLDSGLVVASCPVVLSEPGEWRLEARATDAMGNAVVAVRRVWVSEERWTRAAPQPSTPCRDLMADASRYLVGDMARLTWCGVEGWGLTRALVSLDRGALQTWWQEVLDPAAPHPTLAVALDRQHLPAVGVVVSAAAPRRDFALDADGVDAGRPRFRSARRSLQVDPAAEQLSVTLHPAQDVMRPGASLEVEVHVRDRLGAGVAAEVTLWAVDEGVLLLEPLRLPDFVAQLFAWPDAGTITAESRRYLAKQLGLTTPEKLALLAAGWRPLYAGGRHSSSAAIRPGQVVYGGPSGGALLRQRFVVTPYFAAQLESDADGRLRTTIPLPDNLGRFRIFAVAAAEVVRFGQAETTVQVQQELMLRAALPRFAHLGDRFDAGVVVVNATDRDLTVHLEATSEGILLQGAAKREVRVGAQRSLEVPFSFSAEAVGTARLAFRAHSAAGDDALLWPLPVLERTQVVQAALFGVLEAEASTCPDGVQEACQAAVTVPLRFPPPGAQRQGALTVRLATSAISGLGDAAQFLVQYPHGCLEQTASRLVPLLTLGELGGELSGLEEEQRADLVAQAMARLASMQLASGAFAYWPGGEEAHEVATLWTLLVLGDAARVGRCPADELCGRLRAEGLRWTTALAQRLPRADADGESWAMILALAAYVLADAGQITAAHAPAVVAASEKWRHLPTFGRLWLSAAAAALASLEGVGEAARLQALQAEMMQSVSNAMREDAERVVLEEVALGGQWMSSPMRTQAVALEVMARLTPGSPQLPKLAAGLLAARREGRWRSTQENAWALRGLWRYLEVVEGVEPALVAAVWLGTAPVLEARFAGRAAAAQEVALPLDELPDGEGRLLVAARGVGKLHYRLGWRYQTAARDLPAVAAGLAVTRRYERLDGEALPEENGVVQVMAGDYVRVVLSVESADRLYYVALEDPLPAGLEPVDAANVSTRASLRDAAAWGHFHHRELRDDRVLTYADTLPAGRHTLSHVLRATTPGAFWAGPPQIEEMYTPESFGRGLGVQVAVQAP